MPANPLNFPTRPSATPQIPSPPGATTQGANPFPAGLASPYTPNAPGSAYGGNPAAPTSAYGTQAGGPPPGMKNPVYNPVYGVWMESDPGIDLNSPAAIASGNAMDSYGASFGASQASGGQTWGYGGAQQQTPPPSYQNSLSQPTVPPPPSSPNQQTVPGTGTVPGSGDFPQPTTPAPAATPGAGYDAFQQQLMQQFGMNPDQFQQLMAWLSNQGLGVNYSTGGQ